MAITARRSDLGLHGIVLSMDDDDELEKAVTRAFEARAGARAYRDAYVLATVEAHVLYSGIGNITMDKTRVWLS